MRDFVIDWRSLCSNHVVQDGWDGEEDNHGGKKGLQETA